jgi:acyl carrier protein
MKDCLIDFFHIYAPHLLPHISEDILLVESGLLDSLLLMNLVAFLERSHNLIIPDDQIVPENFASLAAVRLLVERLATSPQHGRST